MTTILIQDLHNLASEAIKTMPSSRSHQIISERQVQWHGSLFCQQVHVFMLFQIAERAATRIGSGRSSPCYEDSFSSPSPYAACSPFPWNSPHPHIYRPNTLTSNYRSLPVFQLLELVLNVNVKVLDFSKNREWLESEEMNEISRILWKIVGERCQQLEKFIIPKELTYSSTLNSVICK